MCKKVLGWKLKNYFNMYKHKLSEQDEKAAKFQEERINAFDALENRFDNIRKLLRLGKIETIKYYRENPDSYGVVKGTDLINDYFNDIETLLQSLTFLFNMSEIIKVKIKKIRIYKGNDSGKYVATIRIENPNYIPQKLLTNF